MLWNPGQMSPKVQNSGISGLKGLISSKFYEKTLTVNFSLDTFCKSIISLYVVTARNGMLEDNVFSHVCLSVILCVRDYL